MIIRGLSPRRIQSAGDTHIALYLDTSKSLSSADCVY